MEAAVHVFKFVMKVWVSYPRFWLLVVPPENPKRLVSPSWPFPGCVCLVRRFCVPPAATSPPRFDMARDQASVAYTRARRKNKRTRISAITMGDVAHAKRDQIASSQFAVDRQVEQREVADVAGELNTNVNGPDVAESERCLLSDELAFVPGFTTRMGCIGGVHERLLQ
jgi:hypothetical protein